MCGIFSSVKSRRMGLSVNVMRAYVCSLYNILSSHFIYIFIQYIELVLFKWFGICYTYFMDIYNVHKYIIYLFIHISPVGRVVTNSDNAINEARKSDPD